MNPVDEALARAKAAATAGAQVQATPATTEVAVNTAPAGGAVAVAPVKLTMESMQAGQMSVDQWLKVKEDGLKIGDSAGLLPSIRASIDMTENRGFVLKYAIKAGNPAQYAYTYDRANAVGGGSWAAAQERIRALEPAGKKPPQEYRAVDLPFTLLEEVKDNTGKVVGKPGDTLGYTTSTTNWANWESFFREVEKAKLMEQRVEVKLTAQARTNTNGNKWGVLKLELVGVAPDVGGDGE